MSARADRDSTTVASLTADRTTAERLYAALGEVLDPDATAWSLFEAEGGRWTVTVNFAEPPDEAAIRALAAEAIGADAAASLSFEALAAKDWVKASLEGLPPVAAGRFIVHGAHDRRRVPPNRIGIEIEAALAFGTGHHGTTQGCLMALEAWLKHGASPARPRILDVGTGTGVLAIAAALALHQRVLASDIDQQAVRTARANARANRAGMLVEIIHTAGLQHGRFRQHGRYDLVLANILLRPLQGLARPIAALLAPRGQVVLSGLLPAHANAAVAAYRQQGLTLRRRILRDGWVTLVLARTR
jgi:ribosomal protein L11 methyltransferase